ncbi:MAG TPA: DUF3592 domain-containing protein [Oligoflexia bacterium]|nr:DUF3592 domain-containing protein [Oligoflexia bacterium]HMP48796.1 DUF3592 domain-containing protein [Oligoflexia bacterium]
MYEHFINLYSSYAPLMGLIGFLMLAHAHNRKTYIQNLLRKGIKTEGRVIEIAADPGPLFSKNEGEGFAPVVEYITVSGNTLTHRSTTYRNPTKYEVGQIVPVYYINYRSRREATLEDDEPGTLPKTLFITGSIFLIIALPALISALTKFN